MNAVDQRKYSAGETVKRIISLTQGVTDFWKNSKSWAPIEAAELLTKSRLDWQVSMAKQLNLFLDVSEKESGLLILAWTTLGSLLEGSLKLFLSVHCKEFKTKSLIHKKDGKHAGPDELVLENLRIFFTNHVFPADAKKQWKDQGEIDWLSWIRKIQFKRNAIHAFKERDIGSMEEFHSELQNYLIFLRKINNGLPYPDEIYVPVEDFLDLSIEELRIQVEGHWITGVIKKGRLYVTSLQEGNILKQHLKEYLEANLHHIDDVEVVEKLSLSKSH